MNKHRTGNPNEYTSKRVSSEQDRQPCKEILMKNHHWGPLWDHLVKAAILSVALTGTIIALLQ